MLKKMMLVTSLFVASSSLALAKPSAGEYAIDSGHTSVMFKVDHLGYSKLIGRFNDIKGNIVVAKKSMLNVEIKASSIDTNHAKRDAHLTSPDFFNAKQFPVIRFTSPLTLNEKKMELKGELELLGVTKPITLSLTKGKEGKDPWGLYRIGYNADLTLKRSDFGMNFMEGGIGDDIEISISLEAVKK